MRSLQKLKNTNQMKKKRKGKNQKKRIIKSSSTSYTGNNHSNVPMNSGGGYGGDIKKSKTDTSKRARDLRSDIFTKF